MYVFFVIFGSVLLVWSFIEFRWGKYEEYSHERNTLVSRMIGGLFIFLGGIFLLTR